MPDPNGPRLKIRRNTDGSAWWNQPEHSPEAIEARRKAAAVANGYTAAEYAAASVKDRRHMGGAKKA